MYGYMNNKMSAGNMGKKLVVAAIKIVFLTLLVAYLFSHSNGQAVMTYLSKDMIVYLLVMQPFIVVSLICVVLRYAVLLGYTKNYSFSSIFKAVVLSIGLNTILPARTSELVKPLYLAKNINLPFSNGFAAVFLEKMIDIIIILTLALIGLGTYVETNNGLLLGVVIIVSAIPVMIAFFEPRLLEMLTYVKWVGFIKPVVVHIAHSVRQKYFFKAFMLGIFEWIFMFFSVALFLNLVLGDNFSLSASLLIFVFIIAGGAIPIVPGGFGTYEAAVVFAFQLLGLKTEEALPIAVVLHISQLVFASVGTIVIICLEKFDVRNVLGQIREIGTIREGKK